MKVQTDTDKNTLILCSKENFEQGELIKLIGLAKNIAGNFQSQTILAFPDYNKFLHEQMVDAAKQTFEEASFTNSFTVENFNPNFRNN